MKINVFVVIGLLGWWWCVFADQPATNRLVIPCNPAITNSVPWIIGAEEPRHGFYSENAKTMAYTRQGTNVFSITEISERIMVFTTDTNWIKSKDDIIGGRHVMIFEQE